MARRTSPSARGFVARLERDFDGKQVTEVSYERWKSRSWLERGPGLVGWILERRQ